MINEPNDFFELLSSKLRASINESANHSILALMEEGAARIDGLVLNFNDFTLDLSKERVCLESWQALLSTAAKFKLQEKINHLMPRELPSSIKDPVSFHHLLKTDELSPGFVKRGKARFLEFSDQVRNGSLREFTDIVYIGTGGSHIGSMMVLTSLQRWQSGPRSHFLSNVDPQNFRDVTEKLDPSKTLVVVLSKSFSTKEILLNQELVKGWMKERWSGQVYACTASPKKAKSFGILEENIFGMWEWVSGRFSIWSSIGLPIAIAIGRENFLSFLEGGAELDEHFRTAPLERNLPISLALISYWRRNILGYNNYALIPYSYALRRFYSHVQQMEMESNGKTSHRPTSPVVWGGCGTDSQHSFFQHFHQSEDITPVDFILFSNPDDKSFAQSHLSLIANCLAQSHSLMAGTKGKLGDGVTHCRGDKPSTTLVVDSLSPKSLGKLISLYENKVIALSQIWEINPFDQPGVELGKRISNNIEQYFQNTTAPLNVDSSTTALLSVIKQHQVSTTK